MVERRGISRVRHIEVDNLWIQEREARRMLPIDKVFGGDNPADFMIQNVGIELAKKHMKAMGIRFAEGRSEAAAKLHSIEHKDTWQVDQHGTSLSIVKVHKISRTSLYAPSGEEDYPIHNGDLETIRVTTGMTVSGKRFEIEDNWRRPGRAHRVLDEEWTGQTVFTVKASARNKVNYEINAAKTTSAISRGHEHRRGIMCSGGKTAWPPCQRDCIPRRWAPPRQRNFAVR